MLLLSLVFTACNKDDLTREKAMHIVINGYNGTADELEVVIDTTRYDKTVSNGKFTLKPASVLGFNVVYTYPASKSPGILNIRNPSSGKILFSKSLPETGTKAAFNFIYIDNKEIEINTPAADPGTNKLGFYVYQKDNNDPVDIFLYRKDNESGNEYREYLAKNVVPKTWTYVNYMATANFQYKNELSGSSLCFTKAGTTDQWAFGDDENQSKVSAFGMSFPLAGEKGFVQPYIFAPGAAGLEQSRLFFHPDRVQ